MLNFLSLFLINENLGNITTTAIMVKMLTTILLLFCLSAEAQKQLILIKKEKVLIRFNPGDEFVYRLKSDKRVMASYVNNLFDTAVMTHDLIIPFHKIDRVYFRQSSYLNVIGSFLVIGGVGYFFIDQFNEVIVHGNDFNIDDQVLTTSVTMTAVGLPLMLFHKKSQRVRGKYRLLMVEEGSPFYKAPLSMAIP